MKYFVFRNQTVEPLWAGCDAAFSGYGDIGRFDAGADRFVWFYQVPPGETGAVADEVATYFDQLALASRQLPAERMLIVFSLVATANISIVSSDARLREAVDAFNRRAAAWCHERANAKMVDFEDFTSRYAREQLINWKFYFVSQMVLSPKLAGDFGLWWRQKERELDLKRKKCLVLDLDNTLWGGVLGEDGVAGIQLGGEYPGKAFRYWQQALLALGQSGVILAACSKNNEADVLEAWQKHPGMVLRAEHFAAWRINWTDKATSVRQLAAELNIGLDSMVFVDDNPAERELIRQALPMVEVPEFPKRPYELPAFYGELVERYFGIYATTSEDVNKTAQYKQNAQRAAARAAYADMDDYLRSLDMRLTIAPLDEFNLPRIAQMTQKTNQFNLTTRRYDESDIGRLAAEGCLVHCLGVSDRFGDNGITGEMVVRPLDRETAEIDTLLLSCRILGKGIEFAFLNTMLNQLAGRGFKAVEATYIPSAKNAQVSDFYDRAGFQIVGTDADGTRHYAKQLREPATIKDYYNIIIA